MSTTTSTAGRTCTSIHLFNQVTGGEQIFRHSFARAEVPRVAGARSRREKLRSTSPPLQRRVLKRNLRRSKRTTPTSWPYAAATGIPVKIGVLRVSQTSGTHDHSGWRPQNAPTFRGPNEAHHPPGSGLTDMPVIGRFHAEQKQARRDELSAAPVLRQRRIRPQQSGRYNLWGLKRGPTSRCRQYG